MYRKLDIRTQQGFMDEIDANPPVALTHFRVSSTFSLDKY